MNNKVEPNQDETKLLKTLSAIVIIVLLGIILSYVFNKTDDEKAIEKGFKDFADQQEAIDKGYVDADKWKKYQIETLRLAQEREKKEEEEYKNLQATARKEAVDKYGEIGGYCFDEEATLISTFGIFSGTESMNKYALELGEASKRGKKKVCFMGGITGMSTDRNFDRKTGSHREITSVDFDRKIVCQQYNLSLRRQAVDLKRGLYFVTGEFEEVFFGSTGSLIFLNECKILEK